MAKAVNTDVFPGVGNGPRPTSCLASPSSGAHSQNGMARLRPKSRRRGPGASSKWNLPMTAPKSVQGSFPHRGRGLVCEESDSYIFFNSGKKNDPLLKNESTEIYRSWVKSNKGEWLLSSSYLKADICRGNRNSEDKCKNGWGKRKHSFRDRSMADQLCNVMLTFRRNLPEWLICERGLLPMG